jgi:hypothetical protein
LIEAFDSASDCCLAGVTFVTSRTYQPNWRLDRADDLALRRANAAVSKRLLLLALGDPVSLPPRFFDCWSIE